MEDTMNEEMKLNREIRENRSMQDDEWDENEREKGIGVKPGRKLG